MFSQERTARVLFSVLLMALMPLAGCGQPERPRTRQQILDEILALPALYRLQDSGKDIQAPGNSGPVFYDKESGELAWRVWECHNPDCPGRHGSEPYLFICPAPNARLGPDDTILYDKHDPRLPGIYCPECLKRRDLDHESHEQGQRYIEFTVMHELPETALRRGELEKDLQDRYDNINQRLGRPTASQSH